MDEVVEEVEPAGGSGLNVLWVVALLVFLVTTLGIALLAVYLRGYDRRAIIRVHADIRVLSTAIESYVIDNSRFPPMAKSRELMLNGDRLPEGALVPRSFRLAHTDELWTLTTPIAYISELPTDPFADTKDLAYNYYDATGSGPPRGWLVGSYGPDRDQKTGGDFAWGVGTIEPEDKDSFLETIDFYLEDFNDQIISNGAIRGDGIVYDPTNGITSSGDIVHTSKGSFH